MARATVKYFTNHENRKSPQIQQIMDVKNTTLRACCEIDERNFSGFERKNNSFLGTWKIEKREREKFNAETRDYSELVRALRIWTRDLQIFSLTLSQLSYLGSVVDDDAGQQWGEEAF